MNAARVVLDGIPGFANATIESRLDGGVASRSYRVKHNGGLFVLRIDTPEAARLGLNRKAEHAVIRAVAGAGLGPGAVYCEPEAGVLLRPFIPGRPWTRDDLLQPKNLARLADRLRGWFGTNHWPTFNFADTAIVIGALDIGSALLEPVELNATLTRGRLVFDIARIGAYGGRLAEAQLDQLALA